MKIIVEEAENEMKMKIQNKELIDELDYTFQTHNHVIHYAALYNNLELVKKCVENGIEIDIEGGKYKCSPIYFAIYNKNYEIIWYLLNNGANPNHKNTTNQSLREICVKFQDYHSLLLIDLFINNSNDHSELIQYSTEIRNLNLRNYLIKKTEIQSKTLFLVISSFIYFYYQKCDIYFLIVIFFLMNNQMISIKFPLFLNIFYTVHFLISWVTRNVAFVSLTILLIFSWIKLVQKTKSKKRKILTKEEKLSKIKSAIQNKRFNPLSFCYICVDNKELTTIHCYYCNVCILKFDHHCPCVDTCINDQNTLVYHFYLFSNTLLIFLYMLTSRKLDARTFFLSVFILIVWFLRGIYLTKKIILRIKTKSKKKKL